MNKEIEHLHVRSRTEAAENSLKLIGQARREVTILVQDYDEILLPGSGFLDVLLALIKMHSRNRIYYLCSESVELKKKGTGLLELARRFSSFIELRQIPEELKPVAEQFIIADDHSCLQQHDFTSHSYHFNLNDRAQTRVLLNRFQVLWQRSDAVPGIRVTGLSG